MKPMKANVAGRKCPPLPKFETVKEIVLYGAQAGGDKLQYKYHNFI